MLKLFARLFVIALILVAGLLAYALLLLPAGPREEKLVQLRPGSSAKRIATDLQKAGIIRSQYGFLLWHQFHGRKPLKAGEYSFDHPAKLGEVYDRVSRGDIFVHLLVIPEGYNMFDIAGAIEEAGLGKRDDFLKIAHTDIALIHDLDPQATTLEGYLFPDSYRLTRTQSLHDIAATMVHRFRQAAQNAGLTKDFHPTVIYAALLNNRYRGTIYRSDLQYDSPYNTYRNQGLPPGPICNPGRASLQAALHPATTDYLFFVSDNRGHHNFSRTEAEHARNVAAYRRA